MFLAILWKIHIEFKYFSIISQYFTSIEYHGNTGADLMMVPTGSFLVSVLNIDNFALSKSVAILFVTSLLTEALKLQIL